MPPSNPGASAFFSPKRLLVAFAAVALLGAGGYLWLGGDAAPSPAPSVAQPPPPKSTTIVLFQSEPPGAWVAIDGRPIGIAPVTLASVAVGQHEVQARMEGHQDTTRTVTISAEGDHAVVMIVLPEAPKEQAPAGTPGPSGP